jgi:hypothetical protein
MVTRISRRPHLCKRATTFDPSIGSHLNFYMIIRSFFFHFVTVESVVGASRSGRPDLSNGSKGPKLLNRSLNPNEIFTRVS